MIPVIEHHGLELQEKVRVADIINIEQLSVRGLGSYALQAHFDIVLIDASAMPIAAFEFDGGGHNIKNDWKKNEICRHADLPLFHICSFHEVRETNAMTLVRYLAELLIHAREFRRIQETGQIDPTEPFMLSNFLKPDAKHIFDSEFDFIGNANGKLTRELKKRKLTSDLLPHLTMSHLTICEQDGRLRSFLTVNSTTGPIGAGAWMLVSLPSLGFLGHYPIHMDLGEFMYGMAADALLDNIRLIGSGHGNVVPSTDEILMEIESLARDGAELIIGGESSTSSAKLMAAFARGKDGRII